MHPFVPLFARLALGTVWSVAAVSKLRQPRLVRQSVVDFGLLPDRTAGVVGMALPGVELLLGVLLLVGQWVVPAALCSLVLLTLFSGAIAINLARGRRFECRCFGQFGHSRISWRSVARNCLLMAPAALLMLVRSDYVSLDGWQRGRALASGDPAVIDFLPVLLIAAALVMIERLGTSAWSVMKLVARAEIGPALGLPERARVRRWLGLEAHGPAR